MTLQQLKYVVTVANKGTISEAAKELFVSQPSLTKAIKELEEEMSISIFTRTNKGVVVSNEGDMFLGYARQVLEQTNLLEEKYKKGDNFTFGGEKYDFILRETQTNEIIEDVRRLKSEIGILYTSSTNKTVIEKLIKENGLKFIELFTAMPHVFISSNHPLAKKDIVEMEDLTEYPYLSYEQGNSNSFYFSEEILSTIGRNKNIKVSDRATLFNLAIGLNGYTVSSGVIDKELNGENIIARPLNVDEYIKIGVVLQKNMSLSIYGEFYLEALKKYTLK